MFEFRLPDLGEGIHEGELLKWYVKEGDPIKEDDPLCDMETDKAAVTIPSPRTGTIETLCAALGDMVLVAGVLVVINEDPGGAQPDKVQSDGAEAGSALRTESDDPSSLPSVSTVSTVSTVSGHKKRAIAAPATRLLAREMGIDINGIIGTGPGGRVIREDLKVPAFETPLAPMDNSFSHSLPESQLSDSQLSGAKLSVSDTAGKRLPPGSIPFLEMGPLPDFSSEGPLEKHPIRSLRKKTAVKTLSASLLIPHVAHMDEVDVTELEALRTRYNKKRENDGKLTLLSFVIKALPSLLKEYPDFNASVDTDQMEIVFKRYYNIGFAADTPRGLVVPVIRDADRQSLVGLAHRISYLAQRGKEGSISLPEMTGGTFTVTNVGAIGGTHVLPIINTPESAILGMGRVVKKPVVREDSVVIRKILPLTLCFDHRLADGVKAARFVRDLRGMLEDPLTFLTRI
jgi:2-oxoisovalerate dehydrogenase E2 component (dihydrolipoyl transacylase)